MLTNIQNFKNSLRIKSNEYVLCDDTKIFAHPLNRDSNESCGAAKDKSSITYDDLTSRFIEHMLQQQGSDCSVPTFSNGTHLTLLALQSKGTWNCGFTNIASMQQQQSDFHIYDDQRPFHSSSSSVQQRSDCSIFQRITKMDLVQVLLQKTTRKHVTSRVPSVDDNMSNNDAANDKVYNPSVDIEPNGTPESIYLWAKKAFHNDQEQRRAFKVLTAKFVLTYYADVDESEGSNNTLSGTARQEYLRC